MFTVFHKILNLYCCLNLSLIKVTVIITVYINKMKPHHGISLIYCLIRQGPCRKLLNTVLQGIELTVIHSIQDIYIPNCDRHGFFRKKQVCIFGVNKL